jgi:rRNA maturation endonuclease Nob1
MSFFKDKKCIKCNEVFEPSSSKQKFCKSCGLENLKQLRKQNLIKFREKLKLKKQKGK